MKSKRKELPLVVDAIWRLLLISAMAYGVYVFIEKHDPLLGMAPPSVKSDQAHGPPVRHRHTEPPPLLLGKQGD